MLDFRHTLNPITTKAKDPEGVELRESSQPLNPIPSQVKNFEVSKGEMEVMSFGDDVPNVGDVFEVGEGCELEDGRQLIETEVEVTEGRD